MKYLTEDNLISTSGDGKITILNIRNNSISFPNNCSHVHAFEMFNNFYAFSFKSDVIISNLTTNYLHSTLKGHSGLVLALLNLRSKFLLLSGSADKTIKIWNKTYFSLVDTLKGHTGAVRCLTELSKNRIASGSDDLTIKIWDLNDIENRKGSIKENVTLNEHSNSIKSLAYLKSKNILASSQSDSFIFIWDLNDFSLKKKLKALNSVATLAVLFGGHLISGTSNGYIQIWNENSLNQIKHFFIDSSAVLCIISHREGSLTVGLANGNIRILSYIE